MRSTGTPDQEFLWEIRRLTSTATLPAKRQAGLRLVYRMLQTSRHMSQRGNGPSTDQHSPQIYALVLSTDSVSA